MEFLTNVTDNIKRPFIQIGKCWYWNVTLSDFYYFVICWTNIHLEQQHHSFRCLHCSYSHCAKCLLLLSCNVNVCTERQYNMSQYGIIRHYGHYITIHEVLMTILGWYQDVLVTVWWACSCWWRLSSGCSRGCTAPRCSRTWSPQPCTRGWSTSWICTFLEISNTIQHYLYINTMLGWNSVELWI